MFIVATRILHETEGMNRIFEVKFWHYTWGCKTSKLNQWVKPNNKLSQRDKAYVSINYPRGFDNKSWTVEYALDVAGVDEGASFDQAWSIDQGRNP